MIRGARFSHNFSESNVSFFAEFLLQKFFSLRCIESWEQFFSTMASCLKLTLKCLALIGIVLTLLFILDIFSLVFTYDTDPRKDWKFIALLTLIVSALTLWGADSNNPHVLAYAVATSLITITLYYTIELDDILLEFALSPIKAIGLRIVVLLFSTLLLGMIHGHRMTVLHEHVWLLSGRTTLDEEKSPVSNPAQESWKRHPPTSSASNGSKSSGTKSNSKTVKNDLPMKDESEGDWDDGEESDAEDEEAGLPSSHRVQSSAKSFSSQVLERPHPSSRISGSTDSSKPSPTNDGVPTKSSN